MSSLRAWFEGRTPRERRLLLVMLALAALTIAWAGVIRPLQDALASARTRHADAVVRLGEAHARVEAVQAVLRGGPATLSLPLADEVRARAAEGGFTLASVEPEGADRVRVAVQSARPGALTGWLARLEARGLVIESVSYTASPDRSVSATVTLRSRTT